MTTEDHDGNAQTAAARRAVVMAGHSGDLSGVLEHVDHPAAEVRASALAALARLGDLDTPRLVAGLCDAEPVVRRRAALVAARPTGDIGAAGAASDPMVTTALLTAIDDPDHGVAEVAAFALGERDHATMTADVVARLSTMSSQHEDPLCREAAVASLGSLGDEAGLPAVLAACSDKATVRRRAVLALAAFDGDEVTDALREATGDRDLQVRQAAEDLLAIEEGEEV